MTRSISWPSFSSRTAPRPKQCTNASCQPLSSPPHSRCAMRILVPSLDQRSILLDKIPKATHQWDQQSKRGGNNLTISPLLWIRIRTYTRILNYCSRPPASHLQSKHRASAPQSLCSVIAGFSTEQLVLQLSDTRRGSLAACLSPRPVQSMSCTRCCVFSSGLSVCCSPARRAPLRLARAQRQSRRRPCRAGQRAGTMAATSVSYILVRMHTYT
mmetsp:Transcript_19889/g.50246  ORF Transcript_19889/g.50246 Transcript_19889/m.50246 type:complete len:214 (-) Transcript_19889:88-729(-)